MSELKVNDRRWWARAGGDADPAEEPKLKPTYIEELEARIAEKDAEGWTQLSPPTSPISQKRMKRWIL